MLNGTSKKGLRRVHNVKGTNFPGSTSNKFIEQLDGLNKEEPNDLTNNMNLLNNAKNILKKVSNMPSINPAL